MSAVVMLSAAVDESRRELLWPDDFPVVIGRGSDVRLRVEDRWASRHHCVLELDDEGLVVRDLGSKHGTFVNQRAVERAQLRPGDVLGIGITSFVAAFEPRQLAVHHAVPQEMSP